MATSSSSWADDAGTRLGGLADDLNERFRGAGEGLRDLDEQTRAFVKESPFVALGAAILGGFLLGRLISRL